MFEGFALDRIDLDEVVLRVRHGGSGPPVLLLHGHPRTHVTWSRLAPRLAEDFTVVCPDLRGYGRSSKPPATPDHEPYSKRAMARDGIALMRALGHERFAVVGHDRGGYVAQRLALDQPHAVTALVVLDIVPIGEALARCDARFAARWWHWFFLAQPAPRPERAIDVDPDAWYGTARHRDDMDPEAWADLQQAIHDPATVHAMCEDYRAGLGLDREADDADRRAGRRITCPTLVVWAEQDDLPELYGDVLSVWRRWAPDVEGRGYDCGHHIAEEQPARLATDLRSFLGRARRAGGSSPSASSAPAALYDTPRPELTSLAELASLVAERGELYVRWSGGPQADAEEQSCDHASGLALPGLAVNPLTPPSWWTLPTEAWLARQIKAYAHLGEDQPEHYAWVLTGRVVDRGPDNEPLVTDVQPVARLGATLLDESTRREPRSPREQDQDTSWRS